MRSFAFRLSLVLLLAATARADGPYAVSKTFPIGGDGGWDYATLSDAGDALYLPRQTHTQVVDTATGKVTADIPDNAGSHGVCLVPDAGRGFISNGKDGTVQIFDLKTNATLGRIPAADDADGIIYDAATKHVLVMCGDATKLIVLTPTLDPKTGKPDASIDLGGKPEFAATDGAGNVYVNLVDKDEVVAVDLKTLKVTAHWPTAPGKNPVSMTIDPAKSHIYVGCRNEKLLSIDIKTGKIVSELPIGKGVDASAFVAPQIFSSCGDGTLTVAEDTDKGLTLVQTVTTAPRSRTMAADPKTGTVYLPAAEFEKTDAKRPKSVPGTFKVLVVTRTK